MTTATPSKTAGQTLLTITVQATATVTVGSAIDVSGKFSGRFFIEMGRTVSSALTNEVLFRLEGSAKTSGNDEWFPVYQFTSATGKTACNATTLNGATTAGNTTSVLTSGTGFNAGTVDFFYETGTLANSEISRVASLSTNTVTFEEAQTRNHTSGIAVTTLAEKFTGDLDLSNITRLRLVVDTATLASGYSVVVLGWLITLDSVVSS
jgi:hypothetical protein